MNNQQRQKHTCYKVPEPSRTQVGGGGPEKEKKKHKKNKARKVLGQKCRAGQRDRTVREVDRAGQGDKAVQEIVPVTAEARSLWRSGRGPA